MKEEEKSNPNNRIYKAKSEADIRFEQVVEANRQRAIQEEEEHIRAQMVRDLYDDNDNRSLGKHSSREYRYNDEVHNYNKDYDTDYTDYNEEELLRAQNVREIYEENEEERLRSQLVEDIYEEEENVPDRKSQRRSAREAKRKKNINRPFSRVTYLFVFLFLGLMVYIVYFNIVKAPDVINSPYNTRADVLKEQVIKGKILSSTGDVLAETVTDSEGNAYRSYPYGNMFAHVVGYDVNGKSGLESQENLTMLTSHAFFLEKIVKEFKEEKNTGDNIITTLDTELQSAAYYALGDNKGAVVAIEPSTGKIKALVSKPDYDPNSVEANWDYLTTDEDNSPLLNRATYGLYPPGSVFKIVTALEYLRENNDYSSYSYDCYGSITEGETTIQCFNGTAHSTVDLFSSFAYSCNSSFANIGINLDGDSWSDTAQELLFNSDMPGRISSTQTSFSVTGDSGYATRMMTAMGQGETLTNPYHMALITAAIANGGVLMTPYIVERIENYSGATVKSYSPTTYDQLMSTEEAAILGEMMKGVVTYGTAVELSDEGYSVAGKTGTAEYSDDKSKAHSWFVGYSNVDNPDLVVAVIVEGYDGNSWARSIPIAQAIFDAYYY